MDVQHKACILKAPREALEETERSNSKHKNWWTEELGDFSQSQETSIAQVVINRRIENCT